MMQNFLTPPISIAYRCCLCFFFFFFNSLCTTSRIVSHLEYRRRPETKLTFLFTFVYLVIKKLDIQDLLYISLRR